MRTQQHYWRKLPKKRRRNSAKKAWVKTKPLAEQDPYIQWAVDLELFTLNVHTRSRDEINLSIDQATIYFARLLKRAVSAGHEIFLVIHGSSKGMKTWLWKLKRLFGKACTMFNSCTAISKIRISDISPSLQRYLLRLAD